MLRVLRQIGVTVSLLVLMAVLLTSTASASPTHVLLVLDASGSMYLRLDDGQYRITAAKDALSQFVSRLPDVPDLDVGLRVYGAQVPATEPDACLDSELRLPIEGFDRAGMLSEIAAIQAKGATPIAYSLERALEDLRGFAGRKVVVLVTDGAESCGGDVRAAVEALTAEGLDVDVRIIGFALPEAAVRSFDGLGTFESTNSASELAAALGRAVGVDPDATYPVDVTLTRDGAAVTEGASVRFVDAVDEAAVELALGTDGVFSGRLPAGSYRVEIADAYSASARSVAGVPITTSAENAFAFELAPAAEVGLVVEPDEPTAGDVVTVRFDGAPDTSGNWLTVVPRDADDHVSFERMSVAGASGHAEVRIPGEAGELEARFHLALPEGGTSVIGRSPAFASRPLAASVRAPAEVPAGSTFEVDWEGPDAVDDYISIVRVATREGTREGNWASTHDGSPALVLAPPEPGDYEVRYVLRATHRALARQPIIVTPPDARITVPEVIASGAPFAVEWEGPENEGDYLTIVPEGARDAMFHGTSAASTQEGSPLTLGAPAEPGAYEVRYVLGSGRRMLVSAPVTVAASEASVTAPAEVEAGAPFQVTWVGPENEGDYLTIVPEGARDAMFHGTSAASTEQGSPLALQAPPEPGAYEVRYVLGGGRRMLVNAPVSVIPTTATIVVPPDVAAGAAFEITWSGPDNEGDYLLIVPPAARDGAFHMAPSAATRHGSPITMTAPSTPGEYEVRYVLAGGRRMLVSVPLTVR